MLLKKLHRQQPSKYKDTVTKSQHRGFPTCTGKKFQVRLNLAPSFLELRTRIAYQKGRWPSKGMPNITQLNLRAASLKYKWSSARMPREVEALFQAIAIIYNWKGVLWRFESKRQNYENVDPLKWWSGVGRCDGPTFLRQNRSFREFCASQCGER